MHFMTGLLPQKIFSAELAALMCAQTWVEEVKVEREVLCSDSVGDLPALKGVCRFALNGLGCSTVEFIYNGIKANFNKMEGLSFVAERVQGEWQGMWEAERKGRLFSNHTIY